MARSETRVNTVAGPHDLRDVILLSSSPVLPPARPLTTLSATETSRPAWRDRHFNLPLLSSDPPEAATRSGPSLGDTHSKYFANSQNLPSSQPAAPSVEADLPPIPKEKPAKYASGDLESALQRRRDWTPPPIDTVIPAGETSRPHHHPADWSSSPGELVNRSNNVFNSLQTSYGCKQDEGQPSNKLATTTTTRESSFTKRKAIEAISIGDAAQSTSRETSPTKSKAPKKKTRTLTELAVAAYADSTVAGSGAAIAKTTTTTTKRQLEVLDDNLPMVEPEVRPGLPMSKLRKLKSARATAAAKKPRGKKAPAPRKPVLLSPESARDAATRQDFLFGTSSQLATEQSPTFLRHLHTAMQASNRDVAEEFEREPGRLLDIIDEFEFDSDPEVSMVDLTNQDAPAPLTKGQKKQLWGAAARGEDGLLRDNVIDLEDAIEFPEDPHQVIAMAQRAAEEAIQKEAQEQEKESTVPTQVPTATQRRKGKQTAKAKAAEVSSTAPASASVGAGKTATQKPAKVTNASKAKAAKAAKEKEPPVRPNFDILSTAQLTKKVNDYGYKTIKARSAMITLLNECWDAQHPTAVPAEQPAPVAPSAAAPPDMTDATALAATEATKTPTKPRAPRVANPKATAATQPAKSTIRGLTTSPRAALFLARGSVSPSAARTAAIHTTSKAAAKATAKSSAKATASTSAKATSQTKKSPVVFEIDDSESDGRFSSPEPEPLAISRELDEDIDIDEDDIVATDLDEDDNNDMDNDEADMSLADAPLTYEESELFRYIATAVTSAPMSNDPTAPSWHEKILMYDTIILETFTAWLNDGPLQKAGYAGVDVLPGDVKKWCESKSVCCTWRKNLQGKERKW